MSESRVWRSVFELDRLMFAGAIGACLLVANRVEVETTDISERLAMWLAVIGLASNCFVYWVQSVRHQVNERHGRRVSLDEIGDRWGTSGRWMGMSYRGFRIAFVMAAVAGLGGAVGCVMAFFWNAGAWWATGFGLFAIVLIASFSTFDDVAGRMLEEGGGGVGGREWGVRAVAGGVRRGLTYGCFVAAGFLLVGIV